MITKNPYGFGPEIKAHRIGTEPTPGKQELVHKPDPQPVIDRCLTCKETTCYGNCTFESDGTPKPTSYAVRKLKMHEKRMRMAEEEDRRETARAKEIARMVLDGWCESGIAHEKGMSLKEVQFLVKQARKKGFLY